MKKYFIPVALLLAALVILFSHCKKKEDKNTVTCTWTTVFFDDFDRADGPVGPNYTVQCHPSGEAFIQSGKLYVTGQYWAVRYIQGIGEEKLRISILLYTTDSSGFYCGVTGRSRDLGNNAQEFIMGLTSMTKIEIMKCLQVQPFSLGSLPFTLEANTTYKLSLEINGGVYTVRIEDINTGAGAFLTVTDASPLFGTTVSINGAGPQGFFDDFRVEVCK